MSNVRARKIKLLLLDVDGVMTDGKLFFIPTPAPESPAGDRPPSSSMLEVKGFHAHDGLGVSLARLGGIQLGLITKRVSETVRQRARDLKIEHVSQGADSKLTAFLEILAKENLKPEEAAFVGDDIVDLPVMRACGLAIAPANARPQVKAEAHHITENRGGEGAVRDAIEYILAAQGSLERCIDAYMAEHTPAAQKLQ